MDNGIKHARVHTLTVSWSISVEMTTRVSI